MNVLPGCFSIRSFRIEHAVLILKTDRIISIEDAAELQLQPRHAVRDIPLHVIREQIASAVGLIIQWRRDAGFECVCIRRIQMPLSEGDGGHIHSHLSPTVTCSMNRE